MSWLRNRRSTEQFTAEMLPLVRTTDPETSHAAAASIVPGLSTQRAQVLALIQQVDGIYSDGGATAYEVAARSEIQQSVVARRMTDLHQLGLVRDSGRTRPGSSGRQLIIWMLTEAGRKALKGSP